MNSFTEDKNLKTSEITLFRVTTYENIFFRK